MAALVSQVAAASSYGGVCALGLVVGRAGMRGRLAVAERGSQRAAISTEGGLGKRRLGAGGCSRLLPNGLYSPSAKSYAMLAVALDVAGLVL